MTGYDELHDELRTVASGILGASSSGAVGWDALTDAGWLGLEVDESLGGAGATFAELAVVLEEMGRARSSSPYFGAAVLGVGALHSVVPGEERDALLRDIAAGTTRVAVALAPGADEPTCDPPFRIRRSERGIRLDGRAEFVVDAATVDRLLLLAETTDGDRCFAAVPTGSVQVIDQPVLDATRRFGTVVADDLALPEASILTIQGEPTATLQLLIDRAAVAIVCDSIGLGTAMLDATVAYVGARRQFGREIGSFQAVKHACADMLVDLTVGRELLSAAVAAIATNESSAALAAARAKSFAGPMAVGVVGTAMQLHGGIGYTWESDVHVYLKRAVLNRSLFGSATTHRRRISSRLERVDE